MSQAPLPPNAPDAEESVLGAVLVGNPNTLATVAEHVTPADMYRHSHGLILQAALDLDVAGEAVDFLSVIDRLKKNGQLAAAGGGNRIRDLAALVPATANVAHWARIVKDTATLRELIRVGSEIARLGWEHPGQPEDLVEQAQQMAYQMGSASTRGLRAIGDNLAAMYDQMAELARTDTDLIGTPTGFRDLDKLTLGFQPGNLALVAARPSMGKSALALCMAGHLAFTQNLPVALFSMEMSETEVHQRYLAMRARVELTSIRSPRRLHVDEWQRVHNAFSYLEPGPLYINDSGSLTVAGMRSDLRRLKAQQPKLAMAVVDYVQLMAGSGSQENRTQEVSQITRQLKVMAKDLEMPVIALSQLSRAVEHRNDKRPVLSDLRESGSLEQDADLVMFIYRDSYYNKNSDQEGIAEVNLAKHRNGPTDTVKLAWSKEHARFTDLAPPRHLAVAS